MHNINLSSSLENYLETLLFLNGQGPIRVTDLALKMQVSKASVTKAVIQLKELELVNHAHYGTISLTASGYQIATDVAKRHDVLFNFLKKIGVDDVIAESEACIIEHSLSYSTIEKLENHMKGL